MDSKIQNIILVIILLFAFASILNAQSTRSLINDGVDLYERGKINDAEVNFKKGANKSPKNLQANFNLGDAYYKNKKYDKAINVFQKALLMSDEKNFKSKVYYNIGNSFLKQKKLKESIEAYKNALKLSPNDIQTKYNLSYALQQMKKNKNKNDKNKNKDKDKNQQEKNQKNKQNNQNNPEQNPAKQKKNKISKEQAKQILNALMNNEKKLQKKLRKRKAKVVKTEKDW
ncbi:MAG: tetratricopeptide repeat protein [Bacteroidetes bacterium]|nr:tetratricopeptide repeat protein [Bacteroidota bacterium]